MTDLVRLRPAETVVATPAWFVALAWLLLPVLGAGLGWWLPSAAEWLAAQGWAPLRGPARLVAGLPRGWATGVAVVLGGLGGGALAGQVVWDSLRVAVRDDGATVRRRDATARVARAAARAVFVDSGVLVLLDGAGRELARERSDQRPGALAAAFTAHGWPWRDGDPYRDAYRRWVPGAVDLPPGADAVLAARQRALGRGDADDAASLRAELGRLAVVVRDDGKRQHWRPAG